jgi:hypothetical protein
MMPRSWCGAQTQTRGGHTRPSTYIDVEQQPEYQPATRGNTHSQYQDGMQGQNMHALFI